MGGRFAGADQRHSRNPFYKQSAETVFSSAVQPLPDTDEDDYGEPSDEESSVQAPSRVAQKQSTAHANTAEHKTLGSEMRMDKVQEAHARIIEQERRWQNERTLQILEGKTSAGQLQHGMQRSQTLPSRGRGKAAPHPTDQALRPMAPETALASSDGFPRGQPVRRAATMFRGRGRQISANQQSSTGAQFATNPMPFNSTGSKVLDPSMSTGRTHDLTKSFDHMYIGSPPQPSGPTVRVYVQNMQRYVNTQTSPNMVSLSLLNAVLMQCGLVPADELEQGWAMFEVLPDVGLERPLREYERIEDVIQSRHGAQGHFLVKQTPWSGLLGVESIPHFSAVLGGFVSAQLEPRKWSRRWLELRDHSLFVARTETVRVYANHLESP